MIKKNDIVSIKPEWQDDGDGKFVWTALDDEDGGRVRIAPLGTGFAYIPNYVVNTSMLVDSANIPVIQPTQKSAREWFNWLVNEMGVVIHPDDNPSGAVDHDGKPIFTPQEALKISGIMSQMRQALGDELYEIGASVMRERLCGHDDAGAASRASAPSP